jgi:hypothetical protein
MPLHPYIKGQKGIIISKAEVTGRWTVFPTLQKKSSSYVHFFVSFFTVSSDSIFAMLRFVRQRPGLKPRFFASSLSVFVSRSLLSSLELLWLHRDQMGIVTRGDKVFLPLLFQFSSLYDESGIAG